MKQTAENIKEAALKAAESIQNMAQAIETPETSKNWVSFKAYIDVNDALALRKFFESRNIEFEAI